MNKRIWKKTLLSIGVLFIVTASMAQEITIEVRPGVIVIQEDYAWVCFPPMREQTFCAKVHKSQFCPIEIVQPGVIKCYEEMMAGDG